MANSTEIVTQRLRLRPLTRRDAKDLVTIESADKTNQEIPTDQEQAIAKVEKWIQECLDAAHSLIFAVSLRQLAAEQGVDMIGIVGLNPWEKVYLEMHPEFRGLGYGSEALRAFQTALFKHQPDRKVLEATVKPENTASQHVLEKCEFVHQPKDEELEIDSVIEQGPRRRLSVFEKQEIKTAIKGLRLPNGPEIEPIRPAEADDPRRKLGRTEEEDLKGSIGELDLVTGPEIQPVRPVETETDSVDDMMLFSYKRPV